MWQEEVRTGARDCLDIRVPVNVTLEPCEQIVIKHGLPGAGGRQLAASGVLGFKGAVG